MAEVIKTVEDESSDSKPVDDTKSEKRVGDVKPAKRHLGIPQAVFLVSALFGTIFIFERFQLPAYWQLT